MNKLKLFVENFLIYGLGGVIGKLIPLIMVPIVTRIMPGTEYFGISDLSNTVVEFGSAIAIMGMADAMYRMFFEKEELRFRKSVCSTALVFTLCTSAVVFVIMLLCKDLIAQYFFSDRKYAYVVYLSALAMLVTATNTIVNAPTRMQNKRGIFLITNTVGPALAYGLAIPLLLKGYYVIALPLAAVISGLTIEVIYAILNRSWFDFRLFDRGLLKQMLVIALPLLPNFLIYWVFNSCDKIMITNMIGIGAAGIYSVGSKIGHISNLIYVGFAGGWHFFTFSTMKEKDQVRSNSLIFEYLGVISFVTASFITAWSYIIIKVLFTDQYLGAYLVVPYLFLAPLMQMLFHVASSQFLVIKKTWPNLFILPVGAIANIAINYFLIPVMGIEGASLATLMGYIIADVICVTVLCRLKLMVISKRFLAATALMAGFMLLWRLTMSTSTGLGTLAALALTAVIALLYREDIKTLLKTIRGGRGQAEEVQE